jgi:hypothetical protein
MHNPDSIDVYVQGDPDDPRQRSNPTDGVNRHYGPPLHPDDVAVVDGVPVTSVARTLIDLAEVMSEEQLRECFVVARSKGLLDLDELAAARGRVEWRPSLAMLDRVVAELT